MWCRVNDPGRAGETSVEDVEGEPDGLMSFAGVSTLEKLSDVHRFYVQPYTRSHNRPRQCVCLFVGVYQRTTSSPNVAWLQCSWQGNAAGPCWCATASDDRVCLLWPEKNFYFSKALVYEINRVCVTSFIGWFRTHSCLCKNWLRLKGSIYPSGFETRMSTLMRLELQPDTVQRRGCSANPGRGSC